MTWFWSPSKFLNLDREATLWSAGSLVRTIKFGGGASKALAVSSRKKYFGEISRVRSGCRAPESNTAKSSATGTNLVVPAKIRSGESPEELAPRRYPRMLADRAQVPFHNHVPPSTQPA